MNTLFKQSFFILKNIRHNRDRTRVNKASSIIESKTKIGTSKLLRRTRCEGDEYYCTEGRNENVIKFK